MKLIAIIALLVSLNAHATGGFTCVGTDAEGMKVEVYGTTGRVPGNPLVSDVQMVRAPIEIAQVFNRDTVVGYWSSAKKFKIAIVDANAENIILKITAKKKKDSDILSGKLTIQGDEKIEVNCEME
jgi:hypothetical protein